LTLDLLKTKPVDPVPTMISILDVMAQEVEKKRVENL
jgi:hypothetical protein